MVQTELHESLQIPIEKINLPGELHLPAHCTSLVLFAHGSGSSRLSPRNQFVARHLQQNNIGTFLFDLLAPDEDDLHSRFNIEMLANRLVVVTEWLLTNEFASDLNLGYFGASTGAASALFAAAELGDKIKAVVSRGGRPDLAMPILSKVEAATLVIVGSLDHDVIELNKKAFEKIETEKDFIIIPGASHLFEEFGKLEAVADHATNWFSGHLNSPGPIV